ncbi:MAG: choice-of-anchor Q domain-containing protein [Candidatus Acidiferrales bacterium]
MGKSLLFIGLLLGGLFVASNNSLAQSAPPAIFYTDLVSGPNSSGQNSQGTILTIYGARFGATQGSSTVTIGGGQAAAYLAWSDSKISVSIGAAANTGNVVVATSAGSSNGAPFTVRAGSIFCVSPSGNDSASGAFGSCWQGLMHAKKSITAGSIVYLMNGVSYTAEDSVDPGLRSSFNPDVAGTQSNPVAWIAYPGATVTIGGSQDIGVRNENNEPFQVFAGITLRAGTIAMDTAHGEGWRVIANDISCPNGNAPEGCFESAAIFTSMEHVLGNNVHDVSVNVSAGKQYHAVYFTTDSNHIDFGWNFIHANATCRALQFHSSPLSGGTGFNQYDLHVHDNVINGDHCDGINFATIDPSKGTVEAYNNVIANVGLGPDPPDGAANYVCIYFPGTVNTGSAGSGAALVYNNTFYNCGPHAGPFNGNGAVGRFDGSNPNVTVTMTDNIIEQLPGEPYLEPSSTGITGDHNLFFGAGAPPAGFTNSVNLDALLTNALAGDFSLQSLSPAIDAGVNTSAATDIIGIIRPQGKAYDMGAYEFFTGSSVPKPNPPQNLSVVVK